MNQMCFREKVCKSKVSESKSEIAVFSHESFCEPGGLWIFCCDIFYRSVSWS